MNLEYEAVLMYTTKIKELEAKFESCNRARQAAEKECKKLKREALELSSQISKYLARDYVDGVYQSENKKLKESRDYALNTIKDYCMGKLCIVPRELSDDDLEKLSEDNLQVPIGTWRNIILMQYAKFIKHFTPETLKTKENG
jgi:hypothetical protein